MNKSIWVRNTLTAYLSKDLQLQHCIYFKHLQVVLMTSHIPVNITSYNQARQLKSQHQPVCHLNYKTGWSAMVTSVYQTAPPAQSDNGKYMQIRKNR